MHSDTEKAYADFRAAALRFCAPVEHHALTGTVALQVLQHALLSLYASASNLRYLEPNEAIQPTNDEVPRLRHAEWQAIYLNLKTRLPVDAYPEVFDPLASPPGEVILGSLADDLADIWRDLKPGLQIELTAPEPIILAVKADWCFSFKLHWGQHAVAALKVLHWALETA